MIQETNKHIQKTNKQSLSDDSGRQGLMPRRTALRSLLLAAGGTFLLPSCLQSDRKVSIPLNNIRLSGSDERMLAVIVETIIPKTDTPGARELGVNEFVCVMVDDCSGPEAQQRFMKGFSSLDAMAGELYNRSFEECGREDRVQILTHAEEGKYQDELNAFVKQVKELTVQGYLKSQYVMSNLLKYELVPGRFRGSAPVNEKILTAQNG